MKIPGSAGLLKILSDAVVDHLRERRAALTGGRSGGARTARAPISSGSVVQAKSGGLEELHDVDEALLENGRAGAALPAHRTVDEQQDQRGEVEATGDSPIVITAELRHLSVKAVGLPDAGDRHAMERALYAGVLALEKQPAPGAGTIPVSQGGVANELALKRDIQTKDVLSNGTGTGRQLPEPEVDRSREAEARIDASELQLVVFRLAGELYGTDISGVSEIIRMQSVTRLPRTPEFIEGMISVRGAVYPVIDLRKRFDVAVGESTDESRIVLIEIGGHSVGVIVDAVVQVLRVSSDKVTPLSALLPGSGAEFVEGILNEDERLIIVVDLEVALGEALATRPNGAAATA